MGSIAAGQRIKASDFAWKTWTPTYANLTTTGATITARYRQLGDSVEYYWQFIYGTGSAVGTIPTLTLPVAPASFYSTASTGAFPGFAHLLDATVTDRQGTIKLTSGSTIAWYYWDATPKLNNVTATAPFTWGAGDTMTLNGLYKVA